MTAPKLPLPGDDLGLFTDLYELTMSQAFFRQGMSAPATFSLFTRTYPPNRAYFVSAGLEDVLDYLSNLNFSGRAIDYLRATGISLARCSPMARISTASVAIFTVSCSTRSVKDLEISCDSSARSI